MEHTQFVGLDIHKERISIAVAESMKHVEAVLKLLHPGYSVRGISVRRRKPNPWFKRGTVFRHALDILRVAERPLTAREITGRMLTARGVTDAEPKAARDLTGGVQSSLRNHRGQSVVTVGEGDAGTVDISVNPCGQLFYRYGK